MVLCQIRIDSSNALTLPSIKHYFCGLSGKFKARLINIVWSDFTNALDYRIITLKSNCFRLPYGSSQGVMFCNKSSTGLGNPQGSFNFEIEAIGNSIDLELTSNLPYQGGAQDTFNFCILSFDVQRIENE
jgi:hypothetical protein